ncbi:MAG: toll/interleukin-1 receptor domain-containing protein [Chitinophagaceae bacterium]|nr:toll/interleukin-1 receptor domain-containing protein [Chitinophagaceae bacterium]
MKIFVSHALIDHELINSIKKTLEPHGIALLVAEHYEDLQRTITEKIENMIKTSDIALILLTENGFNSNFVQQEIGYIKSLNKPYLQIVQVGIDKKITGFNFGKGYILYDPNQPQKALENMSRSLLMY